jgi:hypothetical protein
LKKRPGVVPPVPVAAPASQAVPSPASQAEEN